MSFDGGASVASGGTAATGPAGRTGAPLKGGLASLVAYQVGWCACVLGAADGNPGLGPLVALGLIAWHLARRSRAAGRESALLASALALGLAVDAGLRAAGAIDFPGDPGGGPLPPAWMAALWPLFAMLLDHALVWMRGRRLLAVAFGAAGGPLAYWGGARIGALALGAPTGVALSAVALAWGLALPLLLSVAERCLPRRA